MKKIISEVNDYGDFKEIKQSNSFLDPMVQSIVRFNTDLEKKYNDADIEGNNLRFLGHDGVRTLQGFKLRGSNIGLSHIHLDNFSIDNSQRLCSHKSFFSDVSLEDVSISNFYTSTFTDLIVYSSDSLNFMDSVFYDPVHKHKGLFVHGSKNVKFDECDMRIKNGGNFNSHLDIASSNDVEVMNSKINGGENCIRVSESTAKVKNCLLMGSDVAIDTDLNENTFLLFEDTRFKENEEITKTEISSNSIEFNNCPQVYISEL